MRNLNSNLNVIRDIRTSGLLRNRFDRISAAWVDLAGVVERVVERVVIAYTADTAWIFGKPLYATVGRKPLAKHAMPGTAAGAMDQPCPWHPRLEEHSLSSERCIGQTFSESQGG